MNLEKRFIDIQAFVHEHQYLHESEVLERYPHFSPPYLQWAQELGRLPTEQRLEHENELATDHITNAQYLEYLHQIKSLMNIESDQFSEEQIPQILKKKMSQKKQHELVVIKQQLEKMDFNHYLDIGSGAGHLSSYLLWENDRTSTCIDQSRDFQEIGIKKLSRDLPELLQRIQFKQATFDRTAEIAAPANSALLGLHACGDLSVELLESFKKSHHKGFLNYGCCYHKLSEHNLNLSKLAKKNPLNFTNHSLTLAAKSYKSKSKEEMKLRDKVKLFRYGLHIYLKDQFDLDFISIGNGTKKDYDGVFSDYAKKYAGNYLEATSKEELETFIQSNSTKEKINLLQSLGIIRSHLARLIEIYLILDRALYLKENGYQVQVTETFDKDISPRNISLWALRS